MANDIEYELLENKLMLLYLIDRMELPMSRGQITEYIRESEIMNYYTMQESLTDMCESGMLEATQENTSDNSTTRYAITEDGQNTLELLESHIPNRVRLGIDAYVKENRQLLKKVYENTATFFPNSENNEYKVKCGVYEEKRAIMELFISVETREQARLIQGNWKANSSVLYQRIMEALTAAP